jgi:prenyltransferase beta subunit
MNRWTCRLLLASVALVAAPAAAVRAEPLEPQYEKMVEKALQWLIKQQHEDGHWEAGGGQFASAMTAMAGINLLQEGSTLREGRFRKQIKKACEWLMDHSQKNGLIGEPNAPNQNLGYNYGHGFSLIFLSQIYGEEEDVDRRRKLEDLLTRGVEFACRVQTSRGGWGYVSAADGNDFDEGSVSVTLVQGLRACRNAGIVVPKEAIDKTIDYLKKCTTSRGGLIYSLQSGGGGERPTITVAAIASGFSLGEYNSPLPKTWLKFVQPLIPLNSVGGEQYGHSEYTHLYYGQVAYALGEDGYVRMFPGSKKEDWLTWSKYKKEFFTYLMKEKQNDDGSFRGTPIGPVYTTVCYLTVLQLDRATLPIYQR